MITCPLCDTHGRVTGFREYITLEGIGRFGKQQGKVTRAIERANFLLNDAGFVEWIMGLEDFDLSRDIDGTGVNGRELVCFTLSVRRVVSVKSYSWGSSNAKFKSKYPSRINLNRKYVRLDSISIEELSGTIIHEYFHALDRVLSFISFGHGSNSSKGKGETLPYKIGNKAKVWRIVDAPVMS